jgi:hypothetical protein
MTGGIEIEGRGSGRKMARRKMEESGTRIGREKTWVKGSV